MAKLHHSQAGLLLIRNQSQIMLPLDREILTLGRRQADILLDDPRASGSHAQISREGDRYKLKDMGSTNGTFVNQKKIDELWLSDQDVIEIGSTTICFFADLRDFHGETQDQTMSQRRKTETEMSPPEPFQEGSQVTEWSTTSKKLPMYKIELEIIQGQEKSRKEEFHKTQIVIGRAGCDLTLNDTDLSRRHCLIETLSRSSIFLKDLNTTNGTYLNGEPVKVSRLRPDDLIGVGSTIIKFQLRNPEDNAS